MPPVIVAPPSICASVLLVWPKYTNTPDSASVSPWPPAMPIARWKIASCALTVRPIAL